ncbi:hypothetical protein [Cellulomonas aerilata]|uniref:Uncharacterized protein n=1 Tax=Cellulomonas aerilata TaxID=515326 RepID=A0A512DGB4_9CELL|nr:hypothetical protein [Cellulomonas aerilata]GEO35446.1 hypothetical protein CAE01nite_31710 [Cellulomonas aerilata]
MDPSTEPPALAPRPLHLADLSALIGIVGTLEGRLMAGHLDVTLAGDLRDRLTRDGLLEADAGTMELREALASLAQRLHHAWGAYDEPPGPETVEPSEHDVDLPPKPSN